MLAEIDVAENRNVESKEIGAPERNFGVTCSNFRLLLCFSG